MNFLIVFILIPLLMLFALFATRNRKQVLAVMVTGSSALVLASIYLTVRYILLRNSGVAETMLFTSSYTWFEPLNIGFSLGVDAVSVTMLALSAIIVFTGTFVSWKIKPLTKEFFIWFCLLSLGVFGFHHHRLFTLFMFYEIALIPCTCLSASGKR